MTLPRLYDDLASWWTLLSDPGEYAEEAAAYRSALVESGVRPLESLLELGSGGGNNASHLKAHFTMTLTDIAPAMLAVSRALNPECIHVQGDMRTLRLGRTFDAVFLHDAICYMTTESDLRRAFETAFVHCRPGGVALFAPDFVKERFASETEHGGHDGESRSLRYLEWSWDPDPSDCTYVVDYVYVTREGEGSVNVQAERHLEGIFPTDTWLRLLSEVGFEVRPLSFQHSEVERELDLFLALRPVDSGKGDR